MRSIHHSALHTVHCICRTLCPHPPHILQLLQSLLALHVNKSNVIESKGNFSIRLLCVWVCVLNAVQLWLLKYTYQFSFNTMNWVWNFIIFYLFADFFFHIITLYSIDAGWLVFIFFHKCQHTLLNWMCV